MFDERAFIVQVESADADQLAALVARPTAEEERALRAYLGDERFRRLHRSALRRSVRRATEAPWGNVVVIPGIMGSELTSYDRGGDGDHVWLRVLRIVAGRLARLRLSADGRAEFDSDFECRATGILKRYYGELLLALAEHWTVRTFWFDWRKDLNASADALRAQLADWFGDGAPVHVVAHSMGGLVARTFIARHPDHWRAMWDPGDAAAGRPAGQRGGRLLMLGTPNHGSYAIPQVLTGLEGTIRKLDLLDVPHDLDELLEIVNSFVGTYQMLPSPFAVPAMEPLYDARTYGDVPVSADHLAAARKHHERLRGIVDPARMTYVAGYDQPTFSDIEIDQQSDLPRVRDPGAYLATRDGDGRVPFALGLLEAEDGTRVPTYYVAEGHGDLPANGRVLAAIDELLWTGTTTGLITALPTDRASADSPEARRALSAEIRQKQADDEVRLRNIVASGRSWGMAAARGRAPDRLSTGREAAVARIDPAAPLPPRISVEERRAEELIAKGFLGGRTDEDLAAETVRPPFDPGRIEIGLVAGSIADLPALTGDPVDAIAVGHYIGVNLSGPAHALDRAISAPPAGDGDRRADQLLLAQLVQRGTIQGELAQVFLLPDPRATKPGEGAPGRVVAVAGMGLPGRFGEPELAVLARELCWTLGRLGKQHLATVLIGAGVGNLSARDATLAWLRGIRLAVTGPTPEQPGGVLKRVTFVELDDTKLPEIRRAIEDEKARLEKAKRLTLVVAPAGDGVLPARTPRAGKAQRAAEHRLDQPAEAGTDVPVPPATRLTLEFERATGPGRPIYRFGAITARAAVPEREVPLDQVLVMKANDELAAADSRAQLEHGRFLEQLLIPADLHGELLGNVPLVLMLDTATARIHWEMVAPSDPLAAGPAGPGAPDGAAEEDVSDRFLGTLRGGVTRQLRTTFAPPPEPPPPPLRLLRALVVADPAADAPLPGAEEEGVEVADLLERFNLEYADATQNRIEVVRLFGPSEATRTNVLRHLMQRTYDVLHFAGHCAYDAQHPPASGWIFTGGERITAYELTRIDRIPKFVFSNACESGITPDRAQERSVDLAPSFAEAFFQRGVTNFVCTAWPVDDLAARAFALRLYAGLLGLNEAPDAGSSRVALEPMHRAMREARIEAARQPNGARTWGAYQHYGNPHLRLFDPTSIDPAKRIRKAIPARADLAPRPASSGAHG